jgi:phosphatidate cytidylyltransferase
MLRDRLRTSAILIAVVLGLVYLDRIGTAPGIEGFWLLPLLGMCALGTAWDFSSLLISSGRNLSRSTAVITSVIIAGSSALPMMWPLLGSVYPANCPVGRLGWIVIAAIACVFVFLIREMAAYGKETLDDNVITPDDLRSSSACIDRIARGITVSVYVGIPMAMLVALRTLGSQHWGLAALITTIAVTKSADAGAYFTGKSLGKTKLIPRLSPGKTREGAVGGIVASTVVAALCLSYLMPEAGTPAGTPSLPMLTNPIVGALILGPLLAVCGMIGDLAESLIKRETGAKDSGKTLPGLGGVWDVTDSLIATSMPAYICFAAGVGW